MKKTLLIPILMISYLFTYAQHPDLSGLYKNLGIKSLIAEKGARTGTNFTLEADSIYFNECATTLNNVSINFEKNGAILKISFGSRYTLYKKSNTDYELVTEGVSKTISISGKNKLDAKEKNRFTLMVLLLNYMDAYSLKNYVADSALAKVKKCGTWTVMEYGHNSSTALHHLAQSTASFNSNNSHCTPVGSIQIDCFAGSNHICMTSQSFSCACNVTIPYLGIGWD